MKRYLVAKVKTDLGFAVMLDQLKEIMAESRLDAVRQSGIINKGDRYICYILPAKNFQHPVYRY